MDTGNAVVDILQNPRYEGAMSTIKGVTDVVDTGFMAVITFLAFFIISVALLRNVFAGVYCAFPKFWDAVAQAHENGQDKTFASMITGAKDAYKTASMSTVKEALMRILPNIKCLTDFEDNTITAKSYFIKAIPQMIAVVIIGVFIYNGYYRDATALVAGTGAEFLERTLLSFDPIEAFDTIANTAGRPSFATDNSLTEGGKTRNRVTVDIYSAIISRYSDIRTADDKAILAAQIDTAVATILGDASGGIGINGVGKYIDDSTNYKITTKVEIAKDFDQSKYNDITNPDKMQWCYKLTLGHDQVASPASDASITFDSTAEAYAEDWYVRVLVLATRQASQVSTKNTIENCTLTIGKGEVNKASYTWGTGVSTNALLAGSFTSSGKTFYVASNASSGAIEFWACTDKETRKGDNFEGTSDTCGLTLVVPTTDGQKVVLNITKVVAGTTGSITLGESDSWEVQANNSLILSKKASAEVDTSTSSSSSTGPVAQ